MAVLFDPSKYDVQLNGKSYRVANYSKQDQNTFIPRFGGGSQEENQFDLLRSRTVESFEGGSLQRFWAEDNSVFAIEGLLPKYDDGVLYPVNGLEKKTGGLVSGKMKLNAWAASNEYCYMAFQLYTGSTTVIRRYKKDGTFDTLSLPASLASAPVSDMVIWNNELWITCAGFSGLWYVPTSSTTVTEVLAGSGFFTKMVVYRGDLYGTAGSHFNDKLYKYTGDKTTRSVSEIGQTGKSDIDYEARVFVFNSRIYLTRRDGAWVYDGIALLPIEDIPGQDNPNHWKHATALNGYIYYFQPDGLYRYNGATIEKLYDISEIGNPVDMVYGDGKLWMLFSNSDYNASSRYDKSMGYDYEGTDNVSGRLMFFDGKGLFTYDRMDVFVKNASTEDFAGQGEAHALAFFNHESFVFMNFDKFDYWHKTITAAPSTNNWRIVLSIDNSGFNYVDKTLEEIDMYFDGNVTSQSITVEYRTSGFDGTAGWTTIGIIDTANPSMRIADVLSGYDPFISTSGIVYKNIQVRLTGTTTLDMGIVSTTLRNILVPQYKNQWQMDFICVGADDEAQSLRLADGADETAQLSQDFRGNIYEARNSKKPVLFIDCDTLYSSAALDSSQTAFVVDDFQLMKYKDCYIQIDQEIMHVTDLAGFVVTVERGALGTTAAAHDAGSFIHLAYRVVVRKIMREAIEMQDGRQKYLELDRARPSRITVQLQEV